MRMCAVRTALPPRVSRVRRQACFSFYRGTGNVPGPVYTPTGARTTDDRYPDFIPRPDETPSPNGQHAHVTHPVPDIVIEICWHLYPTQ